MYHVTACLYFSSVHSARDCNAVLCKSAMQFGMQYIALAMSVSDHVA